MNLPGALCEHKIDWGRTRSKLDECGFAALTGILARDLCEEIAGFYADQRWFRTRIEMSRYSFGQGEYKYFNYPLPRIVERLRSAIYPELAPLANEWISRFKSNQRRYPESLSDFTA
jgi:uncharacterized protein